MISVNMKKTSFLAWLICGIMLAVTLYSFVDYFWISTSQASLLSTLGSVLDMLIPLVFTFVGALILSRRTQNVIGWLLMLPMPAYLGILLIQSQITGVMAPPPDPSVLFIASVLFSNTLWIFVVFPIFLIALLFPTGRPLSPRWRWVVIYAIGMIVLFFTIAVFGKSVGPDPSIWGVNWSIPNPIGFLSEATIDAILSPWSIGLGLLALLSITSLFVRYRRAAVVEREQIKWLLYAVGLFITFYVVSLPAQGEVDQELFSLFFALFVLALPIAIGIAILRYRLYDIDIIIRRTLQYALLTGLLVLVYFGSVVLLQSLVENLTGQQSPIVIVISTTRSESACRILSTGASSVKNMMLNKP